MSKSYPNETAISGGTALVAGTMVVDGDTNTVIVVPTNQTAATLQTALGISSSIKSINYAARVGAYADTSLPIFDV